MKNKEIKEFIADKKNWSKKKIINKLRNKGVDNQKIIKLVEKFHNAVDKDNDKNKDLNKGKPQIVLPFNSVEYWGPCAWKFFHMVTLTYNPDSLTDKNKKNEYISNFKQFFKLLGTVLPCPICRKHYSEKIDADVKNKKFDNAFVSKDNLIKYMYDFHSKVNKEKGKRSFIDYKTNLSYNDFIKKYTQPGASLDPIKMADPYLGDPPKLKI